MSKSKKRKKLKYLQQYPTQEVKKDNFDLAFWSKTAVVLSLLIYIFLIIPFTKQGVMSGHDIGAHMTYTKIFQQALSEGQLPVRMIDWVVPGFNQPLFNFYQPGGYYLAQLPHLWGTDTVGSIYLTTILLWGLSAYLMFLFAKNLLGSRLAGFLAAAFYTFAPYHIADVFVRAALGEFAALAFIPGLFWAVERFLATGKRYYLLPIGIFTTLTIISHPPTLLMFAVPLGLFVALQIRLISLIRPIGLISALALGFFMAGFFIIPSLTEQQFIQNIWLKIGYYDFHQHFACFTQLIWSNWGYGISGSSCNDGFSFQLGILHWLALLGAISYLAIGLMRPIRPIGLILPWLLAIAFFGLFMTLESSRSIWENTPFLPFLQYPWRFLAVAIFATSIMGGFLINLVPAGWGRLAFFVTTIIMVPLFYAWFLHPATYYPKEVFEKENLVRFTPEFGYFPKFTQLVPDPKGVPKEEASIAGGEGTVNKTSSTFTSKKWQVEAKSEVLLHLYVHYFPGWQVLIDGKSVKPNYGNEFGFIEIPIEKGTHQITAVYKETAIQSWSNLASILAITTLIILALTPRRATLY